MPVKPVDIITFLSLCPSYPVLDVRSPSEYVHAHIPGAVSFPLFTDQERKVVGTAYKQKGRNAAVNIGIGYFSASMKQMADKAHVVIKKNADADNTVLVHCWRGGMRSEAVAWLLSLYGYDVFVLKGGYKSFRRWTHQVFEKKYRIKILGGNTGSGKTEMLQHLATEGHAVIDLEALANHRGSTFGALGQKPQPTQEMFENNLALRLKDFEETVYNVNGYPKTLWMEDESRHIGSVGIPEALWKQMRRAELYFLDIPVSARLKHIVREYGRFDKESIITCIIRIKKRLGGQRAKESIDQLEAGNLEACFEILINYFDKYYYKALNNRDDLQSCLHLISADTVNINNVLLLPLEDPTMHQQISK